MTGRITAIEPQQKNPQRVNIYLDGAFAFGLARITTGWMKVGLELSDEKIAALQDDDAHEMTYQKALHFLSYRLRSSSEVRKNLLNRGTPSQLVEETVTRLQRAGLVNDQEFARTWVENRNTFRPRSKSALRMELRRKGLSDEVFQTVLEENVDEEALANVAARKYGPRLAGLEWLEFRQKLSGYLARRGFSYTIISPVVSKVWKEIQMADEEGTLDDKD
jgi:regulatory protein